MEVHLQKHCVVIFERVSRQVEHLNSLARDVSSLSMCHNSMRYSYQELFVPKFALPISISSFLAVTSQLMTHGKVRYSDFKVIDAILVCLNLSESYHTGIYYYFTCFICADISRQSELLLPQIICRVTEGFFVFCLVLVLL